MTLFVLRRRLSWHRFMHVLVLISLMMLASSSLAQTIPQPTPTPDATESVEMTPAASPTPISGPTLKLFWNDRFLLLQNPGDEAVDVTELDLHGVQNSLVDGQTWFRASFQNLQPRRCVFIYQFDFSGGEEPPFLEDALDLMPDVRCENDEAYYIGVSLEDAVWMFDGGEFTTSYGGVETITCDNAVGSCIVPLTVDLPDQVVTLFWNPDLLVLVNTGTEAQDVSALQLSAGKNTLTPIDAVKTILRDLHPGECVVFYGLGVSPQPRLPENVSCGEVVAAQQIDTSDFVWMTGAGFTTTLDQIEVMCDTFSRASCIIPLSMKSDEGN